MSDITVYCDGAVEPAQHGHAVWAWVAYIDGREVSHQTGYLGYGNGQTSNVAEYHAVLEALRRAKAKQVAIAIKSDSQLVVKQVSGEWSINAEHLRPMAKEIQELLVDTGSTLQWIRGVTNKADVYAKAAAAKAVREYAHGC